MSQITTRFQLQRKDFQLDVSFTLPDRGVTALFGASGSGKTTILRCMAGLEKPDQGFFQLGDTLWQDEHHFTPTHERDIGYVFQDANLFPHLSVADNLQYGIKRIPFSQRKIAFNDAVNLLGLSELLHRKPPQLSGGQRQRVGIARALLTSPKLLLMDEPLASLDLQSKMEILPYLEKLHQELEMPVVYVTHSPDEVVRISDHMILLQHGQMQAQGDVHELMTRMDLPLAKFDEACAVIEGRIKLHEPDYHLTHLEIPGGTLATSFKDLPIGHSVRVRILAKDVSLAILPSQQTSISNILPARVLEIEPASDPAQVIVQLDLGGAKLLSRVTKRSIDQLQIKTNTILYAQVKSVALMR